MIKLFITLFIFTLSIYGNELFIDSESKEFNDFEISMYQDKSRKLTLEQIQNIKEFQKISNNIALGKHEGNIWLHFSLKNTTSQIQKRVLFITEPNLWDIELFVIDGKNIISTQTISQNTLTKDENIASFYPELEIYLDPQKKVDMYIKSSSPFSHTFKVAINTAKDVAEYKILKNSLLSLYFGAISALLLYNLFIYFSIRDKNYLLYIGFVFFYLLAQIQQNTPFNSLFNSLEITFSIATAHIFWVAFHTLFSVKILNIKEYYPRLGKYLLYTGYFLLVLSFFGIYNLEIAIQIMHPIMIILPFVLLFTAIVLHIKKNKLAIFYIIAQTLFLTSSLVFGLLFAGILEYGNFTRYIHLVGSFSEIILFSFALAYKTQLIKKENEKNRELVDEYSKLSFLGQTVINIYHQWKTPVNNIYNSINHIEVAKEFHDKDLNNIIDINLEQIKNNTQYLKDTALNHLDKYKQIDKPKSICNIYDEINSVAKLIELEALKIDLQITISCDENLELNLTRNHLTNLLMILFENSMEVFKLHSIKKPTINIEVKKKGKIVTITISDNGGGIAKDSIDDIFTKNHSQSSSTGIGLYLIKEFLAPKLEAEVCVENIDDGVEFIIRIPL